MKKMACLFVRTFNPDHSFTITDQVTPGCEWVLAGEGTASRKWDGTACLVQDGKLFARYDAKRGRAAPPGSIPCQPSPDPTTGHWPHWVEVKDQPEFKWHRAACPDIYVLDDGTYELVGPKVNGNPEHLLQHQLTRHGDQEITVERTFEAIRELLAATEGRGWPGPIEGIVFAHPDGRMAKIRRDDFGFDWPLK